MKLCLYLASMSRVLSCSSYRSMSLKIVPIASRAFPPITNSKFYKFFTASKNPRESGVLITGFL